MWTFLFLLLLSVSGTRAQNDDAVDSIQGSWLQIYSNRYVQTTSEIDYHCVRAVVASVPDTPIPTVTIHKKAYQHGNMLQPVEWTHTYTVTLQNESWPSLQDNLLLEPINKKSPLVVPLWLREISPHYLLWSGLDNKTMLVWSHSSIMDPEDDAKIRKSLQELEFNGTYKSPVSSYSATCL
jgi:hypothetical protein